MYVLHMNMPERVRDSANTGGQNLQIFKLLNVMVTSFCMTGEGGSSRLTHSPKCTRACPWIALLCVQMKNHHTSRRE